MNGEARLACKAGVSRLGTSPEIMPEVVHPRIAKADSPWKPLEPAPNDDRNGSFRTKLLRSFADATP